MTELLHKELTGTIIGVYYDVYNGTGRTYPEYVYENAMMGDLQALRVPCCRQDEYQVFYKDKLVGVQRLDLFIAGEVVVELKVVPALTRLHRAQAISYLKAAGKQVGLLFNFGSPKPEFERLYFDPHPQQNDLDTANCSLPEFLDSYLAQNLPMRSSAGCSRFTPHWDRASFAASTPMPAITNFDCVGCMYARKKRARSYIAIVLLARSSLDICASRVLCLSFLLLCKISMTSASITSKIGCAFKTFHWLSWPISTMPAFIHSF